MGYSQNEEAYKSECKRESRIKEADKLERYLLKLCSDMANRFDPDIDDFALKAYPDIKKWYERHLEDDAKTKLWKEEARRNKLKKIRDKIKELEAEENKILKD